MKIEDFDYSLPQNLIARHPLPNRTQSRLLYYNAPKNVLAHGQTSKLLSHLNSGDVLVLNNTKVIPARLFGLKDSGGKVELLIEKILDQHSAKAMLKTSKTIKLGMRFNIGGVALEVYDMEDGLFYIRILTNTTFEDLLQKEGHIPLPPYMDREASSIDEERYQTVFAKVDGAIAAPTAGLHFDRDMLQAIQAKGIHIVYLTLHVGLGTFLQVKVANVLDHKMHKEYVEISQWTCDVINLAKKENRRVIAVGTTVTRALESAYSTKLKEYSGETDIFIYPGYKFKCIDCLFTNFHLPKSTLLMLISAFIGKENALNIYQEAVELEYRFFSYGDLMFLEGNGDNN